MSTKYCTIAVLGGTGAEGSALALRFARAGHRVIIGSRDAARELRRRPRRSTPSLAVISRPAPPTRRPPARRRSCSSPCLTQRNARPSKKCAKPSRQNSDRRHGAVEAAEGRAGAATAGGLGGCGNPGNARRRSAGRLGVPKRCRASPLKDLDHESRATCWFAVTTSLRARWLSGLPPTSGLRPGTPGRSRQFRSGGGADLGPDRHQHAVQEHGSGDPDHGRAAPKKTE